MVLSMLIAFLHLLSPVVQAQSSLDLLPPVIEYTPVDTGVPGEVQEFKATVTEDGNYVSVVLHHRFSGDQLYASTEMLPLEEGTDIYSATVVTDLEDIRNLEYYIHAEDAEGNRAVRGFSFDPLIRKIGDDTTATMAGSTAASSPGVSEGSSGPNKWVWGLLGALVVIAAAGAASSGGSGDGQSGNPPTNVTLQVQELD